MDEEGHQSGAQEPMLPHAARRLGQSLGGGGVGATLLSVGEAARAQLGDAGRAPSGWLGRLIETLSGGAVRRERLLAEAVEGQSARFIGEFLALLNRLTLLPEPEGARRPISEMESDMEALAVYVMAARSPYVGVEALKQACASVCASDPAGLGVDLDALALAMGAKELDGNEESLARLVDEAARVAKGAQRRFSENRFMGGAVAGTLNMVMESQAHLARQARAEARELASTPGLAFPDGASKAGARRL